jgi:hypothetical protein
MRVKIRNTAADATRVIHAGTILVVPGKDALKGLDYDILDPIQVGTSSLTPRAKAASAEDEEEDETLDQKSGKGKDKGR